MVLELLIVPPFKNYSFAQVPEILEAIKSLPGKSGVVFYPLRQQGDILNSQLMLYQTLENQC